jgi:hypothetical protein
MPHRINRSYVSNADAYTAWTPFAREILLEAAASDRGVTTYSDLAAAVQERSGISTDQPAAEWVGRLLARVDADAEKRGEERLSSYCAQPRTPVTRRATAARSRATPAVRRITTESTRREVTCHSCFLIVAAGPTCSSCGAPLPEYVE